MFLMSLFFVLRIIRILLSAYLFVLTVRVVLDWVAFSADGSRDGSRTPL